MRNNPTTIPVVRPSPEYVVTVSPMTETVSPGATAVVSVAIAAESWVTASTNEMDPADADDAMLHFTTH